MRPVIANRFPTPGLHELDRETVTVEEGVTDGSCRINRLLFADNLVLLASSQHGLQHALDRFPLRVTEPEQKLARKRSRYYVSL